MKFRKGSSPTGAPNSGGVGTYVKCVFRPVGSLAENLCPYSTVSVHDGALVEEYALGSTTLAVVKDCWSQLQSSPVNINKVSCVEVTRTADFRVTCILHGASHVGDSGAFLLSVGAYMLRLLIIFDSRVKCKHLVFSIPLYACIMLCGNLKWHYLENYS